MKKIGVVFAPQSSGARIALTGIGNQEPKTFVLIPVS
jgi:hypothetical protein